MHMHGITSLKVLLDNFSGDKATEGQCWQDRSAMKVYQDELPTKGLPVRKTTREAYDVVLGGYSQRSLM